MMILKSGDRILRLRRKELNWEPRVSRSEGLKITLDYFKSLDTDDLYKKEHKEFDKYIKR